MVGGAQIERDERTVFFWGGGRGSAQRPLFAVPQARIKGIPSAELKQKVSQKPIHRDAGSTSGWNQKAAAKAAPSSCSEQRFCAPPLPATFANKKPTRQTTTPFAFLKHNNDATNTQCQRTTKARLRDLWLSGELQAAAAHLSATSVPVPAPAALAAAAVVLWAAARLLASRWGPAARPTYLVDFVVHKGLDEWRFPKDWFLPQSRATGKFSEDDLVFQERILYR